MAALPGTIDEWQEIEPGRWAHTGHPEDGVITLSDGLSFPDYWAKRAKVWTQDEINAAEVEALFSRQNDIIKALGTVCFHLANDVRELKGQKPVTAAQFRTYLKGLMT